MKRIKMFKGESVVIVLESDKKRFEDAGYEVKGAKPKKAKRTKLKTDETED